MGIKSIPKTFSETTSDALDKTFNSMHVVNGMKADKQAADAKANRKEAEAEGQRYKAGGMVRRGWGKARGC